MRHLKHLFENNARWAKEKLKSDPELFKRLAEKQMPKYLWIGCADSRIPANEVLGLEPGEVFVHRNVANVFPHADINSLSVLQYGIEHLGIEHVIVCGHYGCGGVQAALNKAQYGLVDNWIRYVRDVYSLEKEAIEALSDSQKKWDHLAELNVVHQAMNVCHTTVVQNAWAKGKNVVVHGWIYDISTGLLKDLKCCISSLNQVCESYQTFKS